MTRTKKVLLGVVGAVLALGGALVAARPSGPPVKVSHPTLALPDGTKLAATVVLPDPLPQKAVPVVVFQTRYWRAFGLRLPDAPGQVPPMPREPLTEALVQAGYGVVLVDVRGTGASEGRWAHPFSRQEVLDAGDVIRWVAAQPWCNGRVGTTGVSYEGSTALLSAATAGPALKAVLARQVEWDLVEELLAPGGVRNVTFPAAWSRSTQALDSDEYPDLFPASARFVVKGVHPVDGDEGGARLAQVVASRVVADPGADAALVTGPEAPFGQGGPPARELGPSAWAEALAKSDAALGLWGSWWDGATASAVLSGSRELHVAEAVIGPWTHEGTASASPLGDQADATVQLAEVVAFFDRHLKVDAAPAMPPVRRWYVAGAGRWASASQWPWWRPTRFSLDGPTTLSRQASAPFSVSVEVGHGATTGPKSRWMSGMLQPVDYGDRRAAPGTHTWRTPPLETPVDVFGAATLGCRVMASAPSTAALHLYLEAEAPDGRVSYLSEGLHRVDRQAPSRLSLLPVAAHLPAGWRLRLTVAAEDQGNFERLPASGPGGVTLEGTAEVPCAFDVPLMPN